MLDGAFGSEVSPESGTELRVEILLIWANEVTAGEESVGDGVSGDAGAAFLGTGTAGGLCAEAPTRGTCQIDAIGGDLGFSCHGNPFGGLSSRDQGSA